MSKPKLLALVTDAFGGRGGIAQYNRDFLSVLDQRKVGLPIVVLPRHAPDRASVPDGIRQMPARRSRLGYALGALGMALRGPVEVVFCGHLYMAPLALIIARLRRARLVVQVHGIEAWQCPSRLRRLSLEAADLVLCVSRHARGRVLAWGAIAPERVLVVPNTVEDRYVPGDAAALRSELGLDGKRVLLTVGRMDSRERYKGHERVMAAIPLLVGAGHDIAYVIVGEGDDRARLEALARQGELARRVRFLGAISPERLAEIYRMADLFVMPSTGEGFGIAFLEAIASGTPAVGLSVAGANDALADGKLGGCVSAEEFPAATARILAAPKPDPRALSDAVRARFGRDIFRRRIGAALDRVLAAA
jgi:phosphatidylinositol alpha-1,6-mannosyltransferase